MAATAGDFFANAFAAAPYKPTQGNRVRQLTLLGFLVIILYGAYCWVYIKPTDVPMVKYYIPTAVVVLLAWVAYRAVNWPPFAEFLIATQAEMAKVTWPSNEKVKQSTYVVLIVTGLMTLFLFLSDVLWKAILKAIGVLKIGGLMGSGGSSLSWDVPLPSMDGLWGWLTLLF